MNVLLVRHGESLANVDKTVYKTTADHAVPLSPLGIRQSQDAGAFLGRYLRGTGGARARIWTSPYRRTRQTADAIEAALSGRITLDRREHIGLAEQQFGLFDGVPDDELPRRFPSEHAHYRKCEDHGGRFWARMPLGESRFDVAVRVHQAFGTFFRDRERHGIDTVIVVSHGVTMRAWVMNWMHLTPEWFEAERNPGNCWIRHLRDQEDLGYVYVGEDRAS